MNPELMSFEAARASLLQGARRPDTSERLELLAAGGRVLAEPLYAGINVPPHDNSAMDGYAVRVADIAAGGSRLPIAQRIPAGSLGQPLLPGNCARIFTGAPIPPGADAVQMQERVRVEDGLACFDAPPPLAANIRRAGEDIAQGSEVIAAGTRLNAAHLGLAASLGLATLALRPRLKVAMFFTGDELQMPGEPLRAGAIYNSNRFVLRSLLETMGCECTDLGIVRDSLDATLAALRTAASGHDLVLTCGGVSVGEEDHVKAALQQLGQLQLWRIAMKPGKPLAWGRIGEADFIGLPGNPVSAFVTFATLVAPFVRQRQGCTQALSSGLSVRAGFAWPQPDKRREFLRVRVHEGEALLHPNQGSGVLSSCAWAEGLVELAPGQVVSPGELVTYHSYHALGVLT